MKKVVIYGKKLFGTATIPTPLFNGWKKDGRIIVMYGDNVYRATDAEVVRFARVFGFGIQK